VGGDVDSHDGKNKSGCGKEGAPHHSGEGASCKEHDGIKQTTIGLRKSKDIHCQRRKKRGGGKKVGHGSGNSGTIKRVNMDSIWRQRVEKKTWSRAAAEGEELMGGVVPTDGYDHTPKTGKEKKVRAV